MRTHSRTICVGCAVVLALFLLMPGAVAEDKKPSSFEQLLKKLDSDTAEERNKARRFIWEHTTPRHLSILFQKAKKTEKPRVGEALIEAIRRLKTREAGQALLRLTRHDQLQLRISALVALLQLRDPRARKLLVKRLRSDDVSSNEKKRMLERARFYVRYRLREQFRSLLQNELSDQPALEVLILNVLVQSGDNANMSIFKSYFGSEDGKMKQLAAFGMYKRGSSEPVEYLKKQMVAGELSGRIASRIVRLVRKREDEAFRSAFFKILGQTKTKRSVSAGRLVEILGQIGTSDDIAKLAKAGERFDDNREMSRRITMSILDIASRTDVGKLKEMLAGDASPRRRLTAALLLFRMDSDRGKRALMNFLTRDGLKIQRMAFEAFAHRKVRIYRSIPVLIDALDHEKARRRKRALIALKKQIRTFFPYRPFNFSKLKKGRLADSSDKRQKQIALIEKWWKQFGGMEKCKKQ